MILEPFENRRDSSGFRLNFDAFEPSIFVHAIWMKVNAFTALKLLYKVHTLGIDGVDVWSLLTKYEGQTTILNGVLCPETVKYHVQKWMGRVAQNRLGFDSKS